ncbi:SRF-type transcription factor [Opisthorchis viverrini]|uniref:SRF-type transcription factor n=1 Tax=Opisthorchis viverrini TaxID=6198 RepID=A0A1S8X325_OPIVI|nr:SRF-type transcription factor [Opisthorchis viverrini]
MKRSCPVLRPCLAPRRDFQLVRKSLGIRLESDDQVDDYMEDEVFPSGFNNSASTKRIEPAVFEEYGDSNNVRIPNGAVHHEKLTKGKQKIPIKFIRERARRHSTFSKRKTGMMKKAVELAELTGAEVLLLIASETNHVYAYATKRLRGIIDLDCGKELIKACLSSDSDAKESELSPVGVDPTEHMLPEMVIGTTGTEVGENMQQDLSGTQENIPHIPTPIPASTDDVSPCIEQSGGDASVRDSVEAPETDSGVGLNNVLPVPQTPTSNISVSVATPAEESSMNCSSNCNQNALQCQPQINFLSSVLNSANAGLSQLVLLPQTLSNSLIAVQNLNSIICAPLSVPLHTNINGLSVMLPTPSFPVVIANSRPTLNGEPGSQSTDQPSLSSREKDRTKTRIRKRASTLLLPPKR